VSIDQFGERPPSWIELESVQKMKVVEKITSLSGDNIRRNYPHLVVRLSPRRDGLRLRDVLSIVHGTAKRRA